MSPQSPMPHAGQGQGPEQRTGTRRDVFWQNVVREVLMVMSVAAGSGGRLGPTPSAAATSPSPVDDLFDGRVGVITSLGQRIPIADIHPLFACSVTTHPKDRMLSGDVQCTVFRIKTPSGESFTLPLSQIVAVHSLSADLVAQLEAAAEPHPHPEEPDKLPFGFAAFRSLTEQAEDPDAENDPGADHDDKQTPGDAPGPAATP